MKNLQDFSAQDYFRMVRRRIWYLVVPAILISVGTIVYVSRLPSIYKSETTILVADRAVPEDYIGSLVKQSVADRIEFARQQIRSRTFVERIAQEFQFVNIGNTEEVLNFVTNNTDVTVVPPNEFKIGFYSADPNTAQAVTRRLAERVMQTNATLRQEKVSNTDQFLDEQLRQAADELAQAEQKLHDFNQTHFPGVPESPTTDSLSTFQSQLAALDIDLAAAITQQKAYERALAENRELKLATVPTEAAPGSNTSSASVPPPSPPPPTQLEQYLSQKKGELESLLTRYKPEHPDVLRLKREIRYLETQVAAQPRRQNDAVAQPTDNAQAAIKALPEVDMTAQFYEAEIRRELDKLTADIARKEATKRDLSNKIGVYARRMNMSPELVQELGALTQQREAAKQSYGYLSSRKMNSDLAGKADMDANNRTFTTIDPPNLPQIPVRPDRRTFNAAGCLAGLMIGLALVFVRELLDPTISDQDSAAAELKVPVLTSIPTVGVTKPRERKLDKKRKKDNLFARKQLQLVATSPQLDGGVETTFSIQSSDSRVRDVIFGRFTIALEQYQMMRAELSVQKQRGLKSLMVTSAVPDEGKTFIACCLAGTLAKDKDKKVLLIDADLRTGSAGHIMGIDTLSARKGLSDVLTDEADIENCLIPCDELNLSFLPAGRMVENPVELLSSPRLQSIMRDLTLLFDWVIVDSAPILPIADASVLSPICDAAIVVVRADRTPVSLIKQSIDKIGRERISGVVLNCARDIKATRYYGHYYHNLAQVQK